MIESIDKIVDRYRKEYADRPHLHACFDLIAELGKAIEQRDKELAEIKRMAKAHLEALDEQLYADIVLEAAMEVRQDTEAEAREFGAAIGKEFLVSQALRDALK